MLFKSGKVCSTSQQSNTIESRCLPFASILSSRAWIQSLLPAFCSSFAVASDAWILPGLPLLSILRCGQERCKMLINNKKTRWIAGQREKAHRAPVLTVSPKSWKRALFPRRTPAVTMGRSRKKEDLSQQNKRCNIQSFIQVVHRAMSKLTRTTVQTNTQRQICSHRA